MYRKILLPIDGSDLSRVAIPHAASIAKAMDAEVVALRVVDLDVSPLESAAIATDPATGAGASVTFHIEERRIEEHGRAAAELDAAKQELERLGVKKVSTEIVDGTAGARIVEEAENLDCDLVVMSSHGRSGIRRAVLGSVTDHVVRHTPGSAVLVVVAKED